MTDTACILIVALPVGAFFFSIWLQGRHQSWVALRRFTHEVRRNVDGNPLPPPFNHLPLAESLTWTVDFVEMMAIRHLEDWNDPPDAFCLLYQLRRGQDGYWESKLDEASLRNEVKLLANTNAEDYLKRMRWLKHKRDALAHRDWQPLPEQLKDLTEAAYQRFLKGYRSFGKLGRPISSMTDKWKYKLKNTPGADANNKDAKLADLVSGS